jgi:hypothetical protein
LERPWRAPVGRPHELDLGEAVFVALVYARHNVSEELPGAFMGYARHEAPGGELTWLQHEYNNKLSGLRATVERAVAHIKNWRILHTDYRRPVQTWKTTFRAGFA